ncbi:hypothetical protein Efla_002718 [Eimeria flavescens]
MHSSLTDAACGVLLGLDFFSSLVLAFLLPHWRRGLLQRPPHSEQASDDSRGKSLQRGRSRFEGEDARAAHTVVKLLEKVASLTRCSGGGAPAASATKARAGSDSFEGPLLVFLGWGLFRLGSMTNHSCWPNAEFDFPLPRPSLEVRALRPIQEGEEVVVSYIDESLPLHQRQQLLKQHYGFSCTCPRCVVEVSVSQADVRGPTPAAALSFRGSTATEALLALMKAPEGSDEIQLEELLANRTGLSVELISELRAWRRRLHARP